MENKIIEDKIIGYIKKNRVSTTEIADCLGKKGVLEDIMPINRGQFKVGKIRWVYAYDCSNWTIHEQVIDVEENDVVFIEMFDCENRAAIGELVSKYILLYRQAAAIVIDGKMRDAGALIRENYPIWCKGFTPVGCFNTKPTKEFDQKILKEHREKYDGAIAVCDDCGVVIIPKEKICEEFLEKIIGIENQEDIWFSRLDHYHENTFEIVCLKKYKEEGM